MVQTLTRPAKQIIGLTGSFGSGKSSVAAMFQKLGAVVLDADRFAHEVYRDESPVFRKISTLFPNLSPLPGGGFDRKKIAEVVFRDSAKRKALERIIHPYVFKRMIEEAAQTEGRAVLLEVPLLFESGFEQCCSRTVVVTAPASVINERLRRKGFSSKEIRARQGAQMLLKEKIKRADFIIDNSGTFQETQREVKKIWNQWQPALKGAS